jgi:transposase-like protein
MSITARRHFSTPEKVAILRRHLLEHVPVSQLCDELHIQPSVFYHWQRELFENAHRAFEGNGKRAKRAEQAQVEQVQALEAKLQRKNEVLAELMEEHTRLKKTLGEP